VDTGSSSAWKGVSRHIHVAHGGRYAKYWLQPVTLADVRGFRGHELTEIHQIVIDHRQLFMEKWYAYVGRKT
jgi:hypothetical protein